MNSTQIFHRDVVLRQWILLEEILRMGEDQPISFKRWPLDAQLEIAEIVAIARYGRKTRIQDAAYRAIAANADALPKRLVGGDIIYGVNTGFGGTADVRTKEIQQLQRVLIRELHYGILDLGSRESVPQSIEEEITLFHYDTSRETSREPLHLPFTWTRAAITIRINSLIKGHSGIRPVVVERMQDLLTHNIIPLIPLRGSISASGDLSPLSYIGGAIQGKSTIRIMSTSAEANNLYADLAFSKARLDPVALEAKEGLAIVNGTAISTAVGVLALHDAHTGVIIAQILTAMSVEALKGTAESFHPFFAEVRRHPGQIESAQNILHFLSGSKLVASCDGKEESVLRQDRYSIRTASQWIGPVLEDFLLAHRQICIECNSATDNPLVTEQGEFLHGGNFQAKAVTSAMEKIRQGVQSIGRMLFTQCTEMINPVTNRGLPPNLVAEDPSSSYIFKGTDLNIAALQAELGFLANPVNHVQSAEMGNQALNSLALISARYTHTSLDVLAQLMAAHVIAACQAFDLRAMHLQFLDNFRPRLSEVLEQHAHLASSIQHHEDSFADIFWPPLLKSLDTTVSLDAKDRFQLVAKTLRNHFLELPAIFSFEEAKLELVSFTEKIGVAMHGCWVQNREAYLAHGDASPLLGHASKLVYNFVRHSLKIPFLHSCRIATPRQEEFGAGGGPASNSEQQTIGQNENAPTVGTYTSVMYRAIRDGTFAKVAIRTLEKVYQPQNVEV